MDTPPEMERLFPFLLLALMPGAVALAEPAAKPERSGIVHRHSCSAAAAHRLIGERLTPESRTQALSLSGASSLRVVPLGGIRDLSYSGLRLTVAVDDQERIAELTCG